MSNPAIESNHIVIRANPVFDSTGYHQHHINTSFLLFENSCGGVLQICTVRSSLSVVQLDPAENSVVVTRSVVDHPLMA